jgi:hypothetical protein
MKNINTLCEQNSEYFDIELGGTYSNDCAVKGQYLRKEL